MKALTYLLVLGIAGAVSAIAQPAVNSDGGTNTAAPVRASYELDENHLLAPGDELFFKILEDKKPAEKLTVTDSGEVNVPYIGRTSVTNKTCRTLATELKTLLEKDYYYRATVIIGLDFLNKVAKVDKVIGRALIFGEVHNQGTVDILSGQTMTVSEAILHAGGLTDSANKKKIRIIRSNGHGSTNIEVNLADLLDKGKTEKDVPIEPNDYIIVPTKSIRY